MRDGMLLRIYSAESDLIENRPALDAVLDLARKAGLTGATAFRGIEGLGKHGLHAASFLELSSNLPIVVETVGDPAQVNALIELLRPYPQLLTVAWPVSVMGRKG